RRWNGGNERNRAALAGWPVAWFLRATCRLPGIHESGHAFRVVIAGRIVERSEAVAATSPRLCGRKRTRDQRQKRCRQEIRVPAPATWHRSLPSPNCVHPNRNAADGIRFPHVKRSGKNVNLTKATIPRLRSQPDSGSLG